MTRDWLWRLEKARSRQEVLDFERYLADQTTMDRKEFYLKYQDYLQLSDSELASLLERIEQSEPVWLKEPK